MIADAPLLGVGLGNYAYHSPRYLGETLRAETLPVPVNAERNAEQPHCEALRITAEAGIIGACCCLWMLLRLIRCRGPEWGGLSAIIVFSLFNGTLDSAPHALGGLFLAALLLSRSRRPVPESPIAAWAITAATCVLSLSFLSTTIASSYLLRAAEDAHLEGRPSNDLYERVITYPWPNAAAHRDYAIALAEAGRDAEAEREFLAALKGIDTGDVYLGLAMLAQRRADTELTERYALECLRRWPRNAEALALLSPSTPNPTSQTPASEDRRTAPPPSSSPAP